MVSKKQRAAELERLTNVPAARAVGVILQGLLLGVLLYGATLTLLVMRTGGRIFRYENF